MPSKWMKNSYTGCFRGAGDIKSSNLSNIKERKHGGPPVTSKGPLASRPGGIFVFAVLLVLVMVWPAGSWPVHDTGQTQCFIYDETTETWNEGPCPAPGALFYGQDGNYLVNAPSFTKLDAQGNDLPDSATGWTMVRDNITGLIWEVKQDKDGSKNYLNPNDADNTYFWYDSNPETNGGHAGTENSFGRDTEDFLNTLNDAGFGGHSDWRLPNLKELQTIVHYDRHNAAAFEAYFPNTASWSHWSSTTYAGDPSIAWLIFFKDGTFSNSYKSGTFYVRAVCGGQSGALDDLVIDGHGTVTDPDTGLMWQTEDDGVERSWVEALEYAENLTLADYDDWRLPTIKELLSIVDYKRSTPSIDPVFSNAVPSYYWSSTTNVYDGSYGWRVNFHDGLANSFKKSDKHYVRAVRAGQNRLSSHLFILTPAQGSTWNRSDVMPITWDTAGIEGNVSIAVSLDGGKTYTSIVEDVPNHGRYDWTVPGSGSVNCMIEIVPLEDESKKTVQGLFSIQSIFGLYYTAGPNGSITGETMQIVYPYADGTAVEAVPDPGYSFVQWSDGSTENPRVDTNVTKNIAVTAEFGLTAISGMVVGAVDSYSFPVPGAQVILADSLGETYTTETNADGSFFMDGMPEGDYNLTIAAPGLLPYSQDVFLEGGKTLDLTTLPEMSIEYIYTEAQLNEAVADALSAWDIDGDGKVSLADIIYCLQVLSGRERQ